MSVKYFISRISLVVLGIFLFFALEGSLRLLWTPPDSPTQQLLLSSIDPFKRDGNDFVTRDEYKAALRASRFSAIKQPDTLRVFCFGGSATFGYPYPEQYSWPAVLQRYLENIYPDKGVEVINLGGTSYGTSRVLGLLRGVVKYSPDLIIVYSGNNEFVEDSYRVQAVRQQETRGFVEGLYLAQLLRTILPATSRKNTPEITSLEPGDSSDFFFSPTVDGTIYQPTDSQSKELHRLYRDNLEEMAKLAEKEGFQLILSTVASNLATWSPGSSGKIPSDREQKLLWNKFISTAKQLSIKGKNREAIAEYQRAIELFDGNAASNFALGQLLLQEVDLKALPYFIKARDLDPAPVRASSAMNNTLKTLAKQRNLPLADIEAALQTVSPQGVPGDALFIDNVHPTILGNIHIARAMISALPAALSSTSPAIAVSDLFWAEEFKRSNDSPPIDATTAFTWGQVYLRKGLLDKAAMMLQQAIAQGYSHPSVKLYLADALSRAGKTEEAFTLLQESVEQYPDHEEAYPLFGRLAARSGRATIATNAYFRVIQGKHPTADSFSALALLLLTQQRIMEAEQITDRGITAFPKHCKLNATRGRVYEAKGMLDHAETIYRSTIEKDSSCQAGWENLGLLQMNHRSFADAATTFAAALKQSGAVASHHLNLGLAFHYGGKNPEKAYGQFKLFAEQAPSYINNIPAPYRDKILAELKLGE